MQTSANLTTWSSIGPVLVGTGQTNNSYFPATSGAGYFRVQQLAGLATNRIVGLQQFLTGSASINALGDILDFSNLRVQASGIGFDDLVNARFVFDQTNQLFRLSGYVASPGVGVYSYPYFARDNTNLFTLTSGTNVLKQGLQHNETIGTTGLVFYADLAVGQAPVLQFASVTQPFYLREYMASGVTNEFIIPTAGSFWSPLSVVTPGRYYFGIFPVNSNTVSFTFRFDNANCNTLKTAGKGTNVTASLDIYWEYAKYRVDLLANQILTVTQPVIQTTRFTLLNSKSETVARFAGLPLNFRAPATGSYYLFIDNETESTGVYYSGTVTITP